MYNIATDPPWVSDPLDPDPDDGSTKWFVYVTYPGPYDEATEQAIMEKFERHFGHDSGEVIFDESLDERMEVWGYGVQTVGSEYGPEYTFDHDSLPDCVYAFAGSIGAIVREKEVING